jgi:uncharacterized membrane protein YdjX (TVP38/TMEM64 family)
VAIVYTSKRLLSFIVLITLVWLGLKTETAAALLSGDAESLTKLTHGSLFLLLLITQLLMAVQNLFTLIPLIALITLNITVFGFWNGYIWSFLTSISGAALSFYMTRYWFQSLFSKYMSHKLQEAIEEKGPWFVFIGRIFPFMPTSIINIAAGMSTMSHKTFIIATILGNMPYFLVLALISRGFTSISLYYQIPLLFSVILLFSFIKLRKKRKQKDEA